MVSRVKILTTTIIIILVTIVAGLFDASVPDNVPGANFWNNLPFKLGLDLQGGSHLVFQADTSNIAFDDRESAVEGTRDVIENRINVIGISESLVQTNKPNDGDYRVIVELAGVFDVNGAIKQIGETPILEFKELIEISDSEGTDGENVITTPDGTEVDIDSVDKNSDDEKSKIEKAQGILERALSGEEFETLAKEFSDDPNVGFVNPSFFVPEFKVVAFDENFKDGAVWPSVVKTQFGLHIIKKIGEQINSESGEREVNVAHILISLQKDILSLDVSSEQSWINTELTGGNLKRSSLDFDSNLGNPQILLEFDSEGADLFEKITERNVGRPVAIYLDGVPISVPIVQQSISGGSAVISGQFNIQEAKELSQRLNAGALPVPIELISQQTVGPTLGKVSVDSSLRAGMIGLLLVAIFMIVYYRLSGLLSVIALGVYTILVLAIFKLLGVTLTLAGIAGFILTIGMAVDANILIFERIKEELKNNASTYEAIHYGFARAWTSIRDANISSLITAVILYWFGTSFIKGFAITFVVGVLVSMFSAVMVTKTFLRLFEGRKDIKWLFNVNLKEISK